MALGPFLTTITVLVLAVAPCRSPFDDTVLQFHQDSKCSALHGRQYNRGGTVHWCTHMHGQQGAPVNGGINVLPSCKTADAAVFAARDAMLSQHGQQANLCSVVWAVCAAHLCCQCCS
jgi:hypothetical protein